MLNQVEQLSAQNGMAERKRERVYSVRAAPLDVPTGRWVRVLVNHPDICEVLSHSDVVSGGDLGGQDPLVLPLSYYPLSHTEISMTTPPVKHQTYHLCGQIVESGDVEGSQNAAEIDSKRVTIRTSHTTPADDVVVSRGWTGHCRAGSRGRLGLRVPQRSCAGANGMESEGAQGWTYRQMCDYLCSRNCIL